MVGRRVVSEPVGRVCFEHVVACDPERFWAGFLQPETISSFYTKGIGFTRFDIVRQESDSSTVRREANCHLPVQLSQPLRALFRSGFSFVETGTFDRANRTWRYSWTPAVLPSRITFVGEIRADVISGDAGACLRVAHVDVHAKLPALGTVIERTAERLLRRSWELSATVLNEWLSAGLWV